jgi:hypothetical protein
MHDEFGRSVVCVQEVFADAVREAQALLSACFSSVPLTSEPSER